MESSTLPLVQDVKTMPVRDLKSLIDLRGTFLVKGSVIRKNQIYLIGLFKAQKDPKTEKDVKCN